MPPCFPSNAARRGRANVFVAALVLVALALAAFFAWAVARGRMSVDGAIQIFGTTFLGVVTAFLWLRT